MSDFNPQISLNKICFNIFRPFSSTSDQGAEKIDLTSCFSSSNQPPGQPVVADKIAPKYKIKMPNNFFVRYLLQKSKNKKLFFIKYAGSTIR